MRDTLVDLLQAAGEKVVAERPGTHRQITEFMALEGRSLKKNPDLVLCNFDGPRSFTVIDVKVCDPAAPTYRTRSGDCALFRHSQLERDGSKEYWRRTSYGLPALLFPTAYLMAKLATTSCAL